MPRPICPAPPPAAQLLSAARPNWYAPSHSCLRPCVAPVPLVLRQAARNCVPPRKVQGSPSFLPCLGSAVGSPTFCLSSAPSPAPRPAWRTRLSLATKQCPSHHSAPLPGSPSSAPCTARLHHPERLFFGSTTVEGLLISKPGHDAPLALEARPRCPLGHDALPYAMVRPFGISPTSPS